MANLFDTYKTFRARRTILSEDFNALQASLVAAFSLIGTAPPNGETGVSSTFHCADPVNAQHAVTKGYFDGVSSAAFAAPLARAQEWAEANEDVEITDNPGMFSAKHWAAKAEDVVTAGAATASQGTRADESHGWGDHALAGYAETDTAESFTSVTIGSWTISESGGKLMFSNGTNRVSIDAAGKVTALGDVESAGTP